MYYITTLSVAKTVQRRRLKDGTVRGVGGMIVLGVGNRSVQTSSAHILSPLFAVFPPRRSGFKPGPLRVEFVKVAYSGCMHCL